jgi:hypothetical protein
MTQASGKPALSVVVSTVDPASAVLPGLDALAKQAAAVGGELIVVSGAPHDADEAPGIRIHTVPGGSIFACRAAGLAVAAGDIVAFTEDHVVHPEDWCRRILDNFGQRPGLVLLGGAIANGSTRRIEDLMNYWMTFAVFAPGQVTAIHPCIAQFIVRASALPAALEPGQLENAVIQKYKKIPGAIYVDPALCVRHYQSHGFFGTFAAHYHNGRATGGYSSRRPGGRNLSAAAAFGWAATNARAHLLRTARAFIAGKKPLWSTASHLLLILPLVAAHALGEFTGYWRGPGGSPAHLV